MEVASARLSALTRIMLVDDNPFDNEFHSLVLRRAGFTGQIRVCETGREALECLESQEGADVRLLFLDVNLPGESGFDIAGRLLALPAREPRLEVVMLTSSPDPRDVAQAKSIPIVRDLLTKPLSVKGVTELVARCFFGA